MRAKGIKEQQIAIIHIPTDIKLQNILLSENHHDMCHWLCICVNELRKEDGKAIRLGALLCS